MNTREKVCMDSLVRLMLLIVSMIQLFSFRSYNIHYALLNWTTDSIRPQREMIMPVHELLHHLYNPVGMSGFLNTGCEPFLFLFLGTSKEFNIFTRIIGHQESEVSIGSLERKHVEKQRPRHVSSLIFNLVVLVDEEDRNFPSLVIVITKLRLFGEETNGSGPVSEWFRDPGPRIHPKAATDENEICDEEFLDQHWRRQEMLSGDASQNESRVWLLNRMTVGSVNTSRLDLKEYLASEC
ncbi:hypothetical protein F5878DRAFT_602085 [Lentinula raphanica]|uniref:Uncharacterized protein n=1 Tax=Lentinula raphanica TaxID=153919 RepID=A0AA38PK19_9AGAR|nr:hypothetical protein F5878DRAFT_602085 [Lentinula raphanica]